MFQTKYCVRLLALSALIASLVARAGSFNAEVIRYDNFLTPDTLTVLLTFDGSGSFELWEKFLTFNREQKIKSTFFISSVYFVPNQNRESYTSPSGEKGYSTIGFGGTSQAVQKRIEWTLRAIKEGHDIESHLNGHEDGTEWDQDTWDSEFKQFAPMCKFLPRQPKFVRFPFLAMNSKVYPVLASHGYQSIVSTIASRPDSFIHVSGKTGGQNFSVVEFPIDYALVDGHYIALMDYNFYYDDLKHHRNRSEAKARLKRAYLAAAEKCFKNHQPLFLSHHFEKWNQGAYTEALLEVITELQAKYKTEFLTVNELYSKISQAPSLLLAQSGGEKTHPPADWELLFPQGSEVALEGTIYKNIPAVLRLKRDGLKITGSIFYRKYGPDILLEGSVDPSGQIVVYELNEKKEYIGKLQGQFSQTGLNGAWEQPRGNSIRKFEFKRLKDVSEYDRIQIESLRKSGKQKDGAFVASLAPPPESNSTENISNSTLKFSRNYLGHIGTAQIPEMSLLLEGNQINGRFRYKKGSGYLQLHGETKPNGNFEIREYEDKVLTGVLTGKSIHGTILQGTFTKPGKPKVLHFEFRVQ